MSIADERSEIIIEDESLRPGFTQIPNQILRDPTISVGAKLSYAVLLSYAWERDSCFPGQQRMAADMGVTERSIRTYMAQLSAASLVTVQHRGLGKTNRYIIRRLRPENISGDLDMDGLRPENIAAPDRKEATPQERKDLPPKNTQYEEDTTKKTKIDTANIERIRSQTLTPEEQERRMRGVK